MSTYRRPVDTPDEQFLISKGWVPRGYSMWEHPDTLKITVYSLEDALTLTEEHDLCSKEDTELIRQLRYEEQCMDHMFNLLTKSLRFIDNDRKSRKKFVEYYSDEHGKLDHAKIKRHRIN